MEYELMGCDSYQYNNKSKMFSCGNPTYFFDLYITHQIPIKTKITWKLHCDSCKLYKVVIIAPNGRVIKSKQRQQLRKHIDEFSDIGWLASIKDVKWDEFGNVDEIIHKKTTINVFDSIDFEAKQIGKYVIKYWANMGDYNKYKLSVSTDNIDKNRSGPRLYNKYGDIKDGCKRDKNGKSLRLA